MLPKVKNNTIDHDRSQISNALKNIMNEAGQLLDNPNETGGTGDAKISQPTNDAFLMRRKKSEAARFLAQK